MVHALLVGIDAYPDARHRLAGCCNDVTELAALLKERLTPASLQMTTLLDADATRAAVVDAFRARLGIAAKGDTALFYYAGHGSRERAPEVFWASEPDRLDETIVLVDSRGEDGWDLADKELAALIRPLAARGVHVLVILDCCHSGSGTRAQTSGTRPRVRRFPADVRARPIESFLPEVQALAAGSASGSGWSLGRDNAHILMAACSEDEEASEHFAEGQTFGAFTYFLLEALRQSPGQQSYRELGASVRARVTANVNRQEPQLETTSDAELDRAFLGGALLARTNSFTASFVAQEWWINGGRIHGVAQPSGADSSHFALFEPGADALTMGAVASATAIASATVVDVARSRLAVTRGALDTTKTYKAVMISAPLPQRRVRFTGTPSDVAAARLALSRSALLAEAAPGTDADFELVCGPGDLRIKSAASGVELAAAERTAPSAIQSLEQITRWRHFAELENPLSTIAADELTVEVLDGKAGEARLDGAHVTLTALRENGKLTPQRFRIRFQNRGQRTLYVGMLALDELYSCTPDLITAGVIKLDPGSGPAYALDGRALAGQVPQALRDEGRTESRDIIKIIVSTEPFDVRYASLPSLGAPQARATHAKRSIPGNALDRLLMRASSRTISAADDDDAIRDFQTRTLVFTTIEPQATVPVSAAASVDVGAGVRIEAHPLLRANASLTSMTQTRGDLGAAILPPLFRGDDSSETIRFTATRGSSDGLSVLELAGSDNFDAVTKQSPLVVHLPTSCAEGDVVLPVGFDGEDFLILGRGTAATGGGTRVEITTLPHPVQQRKRSLFGSIRIVFQKFTAKLLGKEFKYPLLAGVRWDGRDPQYEHEMAKITAQVQAASRVVLFVHGIIGDTRAMGARLKARPGDLYLALDYENLHTTIEQNAEALKQRLTDCGLTPGCGKELVVVAHSMGGLVSRWYIERLGGRELVSRLIMCGTPNAGSNWSTIEDFVTGAATLAINNLTQVSWEARIVGALVTGLERIDVTLDQMKPGSGFLTKLSALGDPGVPYTVLAGNTSLAGAADGTAVKRLMKKVLHSTASVAFLWQPNDIAASVTSIGSVGAGWVHAPDVRLVACDHVSYFSSPAGIDALTSLLA